MSGTIGLDFDNTIVSYDELMHRIAVERRLVAASDTKTKRAIRDRIRQRPNGEIEWQQVQALAYGPLMREARLIDGAEPFVRQCRDAGIAVAIVSHKTEYAPYDATRTNLRTAALDWMIAHRFFDPGGLDLRRDDVYFESTRADKIARVKAIGCSHFVDDLEEVFLDPSFPTDVDRILYAPQGDGGSTDGIMVMSSWQDLRDHFFDRRA
jgi:hypothetical protein